MIKWENLKDNPPIESCNLCIRIGQCYDTYKFIRYSPIGWSLYKNLKEIDHSKIPDEAFYINLDVIK